MSQRLLMRADSSIVLIKNPELMKKMNNNKTIGLYNDADFYMDIDASGYLEDIEYIAWNHHFIQSFKDKKGPTSFEELKSSFPKIKELIYSLFQVDVNLNDFEIHQFNLYINEGDLSGCSDNHWPIGHVFRLNQNVELDSPFDSGFSVHTFENSHQRFAHFLMDEFDREYYDNYENLFEIKNSMEQLKNIGIGKYNHDLITIPNKLEQNGDIFPLIAFLSNFSISKDDFYSFIAARFEIIMMDQRHLYPEKWSGKYCEMPLVTNVIIYNHINHKLYNIDLSDLKEFIENKVVKTYEYLYPVNNAFITNRPQYHIECEKRAEEYGLELVHYEMITGDDIIDQMNEDEDPYL